MKHGRMAATCGQPVMILPKCSSSPPKMGSSHRSQHSHRPWPGVRGSASVMVAIMATVLLACAEAAPITLKGRLRFMDTHKSKIWLMEDDAGTLYVLPKQPVGPGNQPFDVGQWVALTCTPAAGDPTTCAQVSNVKAATPIGGVTAGFSASTAVGENLKMLIMLVSFTGNICKRAAGYSASQVTDMFFGSNSYATFFQQCSYGKTTLDKAGSKVLPTPITCTSALESCNQIAISAAADEQAGLLLGGRAALSKFSRKVYIMPEGMVSDCSSGWVGLAEAPGTRVWLQSTSNGAESKGTVMQELLHNYGLRHSWKGGVEYQDYSSCMGRGDVCPNAYEIGRLRWANALAVLQGVDMPAGSFRQLTLAATYVGPQDAFIKIRTDWLKDAWVDNIYIAYRVKAGGDADLLKDFQNQVTIHRVDRYIDDNEDPDEFRVLDPEVELIGTIGSGEDWDMFRYRLLVRAGALVDGGTKVVVMACRYINAPSECKGGSTATPGGKVAANRPPPPSKRPPPPAKQPPPPTKRPPPPTKRPPPPPVRRPPPPVKQQPKVVSPTKSPSPKPSKPTKPSPKPSSPRSPSPAPSTTPAGPVLANKVLRLSAASPDIGATWLDGTHLARVEDPRAKGSGRQVLQLNEVWWLWVGGTLSGLGPGRYQLVWRMLLLDSVSVPAPLQFYATVAAARPLQQGGPAAPQSVVNQPACKTRLVTQQDLQSLSHNNWFELVVCEVSVPAGVAWDVAFACTNTDTNFRKAGLVFDWAQMVNKEMRLSAAQELGMAWLDGSHLARVEDPVAKGSGRQVVVVNDVWWLWLSGSFLGVGPGRYQLSWRMLYQAGAQLDYLDFTTTVQAARPLQSGTSSSQAAAVAKMTNQVALATKRIDGASLAALAAKAKGGWFEVVVGTVVVPEGAIWDLATQAVNTETHKAYFYFDWVGLERSG